MMKDVDMTQPLDFTRRITGRRGHPLPPQPLPADQALILSCRLLRANGFVILEQDWRGSSRLSQSPRLGVVAKDGEALCFVAVITCGFLGHASPERLVDKSARLRLRLRLRAAAGEWLRVAGTCGMAGSLRFDLISAALGRDGSFDLRHHKGVA